ncbi:uncharacterized protein C8R40DRAFT_1174051 [Lentinula edodes]|uniref:uncharacterized protein n=1 Tax=Lentinula edodes TaxID=5353 RepID=UPI001E8D2D2B|nr:uncharacterized protein C8R40DRAFT_1174051 [Lentinula edodes]KAH7871979.1 hypothetical protein C8R40DRAFT_1174051 [Lentinula edodes]
MDIIFASIDNSDSDLLAEAEVGITFWLGTQPVSFYIGAPEHNIRWTFESGSPGVPLRCRLFGIVGRFVGSTSDLGTGPNIYPVLELVYPNKPGDRLSATFFNQLQVLHDQVETDMRGCTDVQVRTWSTNAAALSTDGCVIYVHIHRDATISGVGALAAPRFRFPVDDVSCIVKERFPLLRVGAFIEATVSLHRVDNVESGNRHYSLVADKIDVIMQNVSTRLGVLV